MEKFQDDTHPLVDISPPVVNSPVGGGAYKSPMYVDITRGEGGHYPAKQFRIDFYERGPQDVRDADQGRYQLDMSPGPHKLHTNAEWFNGSQTAKSPWVYINWFYVLTPPRNRPPRKRLTAK